MNTNFFLLLFMFLRYTPSLRIIFISHLVFMVELVQGSLERRAIPETTAVERQQLIINLWRFFVETDMPFETFNKPGLWRVLCGLRSVKAITRQGAMRYLPRLKDLVSSRLRDILKEASTGTIFSCTADASSSYKQHQFGTVTAHWIQVPTVPTAQLRDGDTWILRSVTLGAHLFPQHERAEDIQAGMARLHDNMGLNVDSTKIYTLDGGSNYQRWSTMRGKDVIPCCAIC